MEDFCWQLDVPYYEIDDYTMRLLRAADMLQDSRMSLRQCARETGVSKSKLSDFIHGECKSVCYELAKLCERQLRENRYRIKDFMWDSPKWQYHRKYGNLHR